MKVVFLNAWHGKLREPLRDFLLSHAETTDVFCFQEADVRDGKEGLAGDGIPDFFNAATCQKHRREREEFFLATYVRKTLSVSATHSVLNESLNEGLGLSVTLMTVRGPLHIINVHGVARPGDKFDNPDRLSQSQGILSYAGTLSGEKIIGGDFNVLPNTESLEMFQRAGYRNLIKEFNVGTTRNRLAWDLYPVKMLHSDYVFVSSDVRVKKFEVPNIEISDHLPLVLEFDL